MVGTTKWGREVTSRSGQALLLGTIALILTIIVLVRYAPFLHLPQWKTGLDFVGEDPAAEIARLNGIMATADSVNATYRKLGWRYAEAVAPLETMRQGELGGAAFAEQALRKRLSQLGALNDLAVSPAEVGAGEAQTQIIPVDVSFSAADDGQAISAVALLGLPEHGFTWDTLLLDADQQTKTIKVSGRVLVLTVKPAE
jgi:hypothetical protein